MMKTNNAKEIWNRQKEILQKKFDYLTDKDFMFEEGKKGAMMEKLQLKLSKTKSELKNLIDAL